MYPLYAWTQASGQQCTQPEPNKSDMRLITDVLTDHCSRKCEKKEELEAINHLQCPVFLCQGPTQ